MSIELKLAIYRSHLSRALASGNRSALAELETLIERSEAEIELARMMSSAGIFVSAEDVNLWCRNV